MVEPGENCLFSPLPLVRTWLMSGNLRKQRISQQRIEFRCKLLAHNDSALPSSPVLERTCGIGTTWDAATVRLLGQPDAQKPALESATISSFCDPKEAERRSFRLFTARWPSHTSASALATAAMTTSQPSAARWPTFISLHLEFSPHTFLFSPSHASLQSISPPRPSSPSPSSNHNHNHNTAKCRPPRS